MKAVPYSVAWYGAVLSSWVPPDPLPVLPTARVVTGLGPTTNGPHAPAWLSAVETAWQPPDPLPTLGNKLVQGGAPPRVAYAPAWLSAVSAWWAPPEQTLLPPHDFAPLLPQGAGSSFSVYAPVWNEIVAQAWVPPDPLPVLPTARVTAGAPPAAQVVQPDAWLYTVLAAWQPPDPLPTLGNKLPQSVYPPVYIPDPGRTTGRRHHHWNDRTAVGNPGES